MRGHGVPQVRVEGGEPGPVVRRADPDRVARKLLLGEPVLVLAPGGDDRVDERVAVPVGHAGQCLSPDVVAGVPHRGQQRDDRGRGVEADRVADAGVLGRVRRQHERDAPLPRRDVPQDRVLHGDAGHPRGALGVGDVAGEAVRADLLEGERDGDEPAVELGDRDLGGGVQRGQPLVAGGPLGARGGQAQALQDRHVQAGQRADVPFLVGAAGAGRRPGRGRRPRARSRRSRRRRAACRSARARRSAATSRTPGAAGRPPPPPRRRARARSRCSPRRDGPGSKGWRRPGAARAYPRVPGPPGRSSSPQSGIGTGGSKPSPVSVIASDRNRASCRRFSGPPCAR